MSVKKIAFTKMHGIGNDYIYIDCFKYTVDDPAHLAKIMSPRRTSVGSDGVILICPSEVADAKMRMFNLDGSEGKMCGNGIRCVGKYIYDNKIAVKDTLTVETLSGIKTLRVKAENGKVKSVTVDMGEPILEPSKIPVLLDGDKIVGRETEIKDRKYKITAVSMGNPHAVVFCDEVKSLELEKIGSDFEFAPIFPEQVNTEFIRVIDSENLEMRVWERGSGETLACWTGACACAAAAVAAGLCGRGVEVCLRGGALQIEWREGDRHILMTGPATTVFEGEVIDEK